MNVIFNYLIIDTTEEKIIAAAKNAVIYFENDRLHIKSNKYHYVYKFDGLNVGWHMRNPNNYEDIFLGKNAYPSVTLESLSVKDNAYWEKIVYDIKE